MLSFCYNDVTQDKNEFETGLARVLYQNSKRGPTDPGKIAMWAWAARRVMDYAETISDELDLSCGIVCGQAPTTSAAMTGCI